MPKKSYKVVFDEDMDLFDNGAARKWTFIGNYSDQSLCRNYFAYSIGDAIVLDYMTSTQCVTLFLNGLYRGEYLVCEQVEVGENRVGIDTDTSKDDFGFMVEMDWWVRVDRGVEGVDYFMVGDRSFNIRSHSLSDPDFGYEGFDYISGYVRDSYEAIHSGDYGKVQERSIRSRSPGRISSTSCSIPRTSTAPASSCTVRRAGGCTAGPYGITTTAPAIPAT